MRKKYLSALLFGALLFDFCSERFCSLQQELLLLVKIMMMTSTTCRARLLPMLMPSKLCRAKLMPVNG